MGLVYRFSVRLLATNSINYETCRSFSDEGVICYNCCIIVGKSGISISVWSIVEVNIAIICSSIPTIRPLLKKLIPTLLGTIESVRNSKKERASGYQNWTTRPKGSSIPLGSAERVDKTTSERAGNVGVAMMTRTEVGASFYDNRSVDFPVPGPSHDDGGKKEVL